MGCSDRNLVNSSYLRGSSKAVKRITIQDIWFNIVKPSILESVKIMDEMESMFTASPNRLVEHIVQLKTAFSETISSGELISNVEFKVVGE